MSRRPTIAWPPPLPNSLQCSQHVPFDRPCLAIIANLKLAVMCTAVCMLPYLSMHACLLSAISSAPCDSSAATVTRIGNRNLEEQGSRARKWFFGGGGSTVPARDRGCGLVDGVEQVPHLRLTGRQYCSATEQHHSFLLWCRAG